MQLLNRRLISIFVVLLFRKKIFGATLLLFVFPFFSSCNRQYPLQLVSSERPLETYQASAPQAMVVTPNAEATEIGVEILKKGGNSADAAIAVSFALSVLRPQSTGIGGGGFLLHYSQKEKRVTALNFREKAPKKATKEMYLQEGKANPKRSQDGALSVAVPRLVAGLGYVYEHYASGKISWADLVAPSVLLAENGFTVYRHLAEAIEKRKEILSSFPSSKQIFLPKGVPLKEGEILKQKDLAVVLYIIATRGWRSFYEPPIFTTLLYSLQRQGGLLTLEDFNSVEAESMEPIEGSYRGYRIFSMPPPSSGGSTVIATLNVLENFPLKRWGMYHFKTVHAVTESMRRAFFDRVQYLGDPKFVKIPLKGLISKEYAKSLAKTISFKNTTASEKWQPVGSAPKESDSTTHFSIVDSEGNAIASTQTINYLFGSGLVAEKTGIVLNDEMDDFSIQPGVANVYGLVGSEANAIAPGKIPLSSMAPTFIFNPKKELMMVLGSPGGPKIISAVLQTILNVVDFKMTPLQAVALKRYHHQWLPDSLQIEEEALPKEVSERLQKMGHHLESISFPSLVMLVIRGEKGWIGIADPRGSGLAQGN